MKDSERIKMLKGNLEINETRWKLGEINHEQYTIRKRDVKNALKRIKSETKTRNQ